jgi:hypothetical protein
MKDEKCNGKIMIRPNRPDPKGLGGLKVCLILVMDPKRMPIGEKSHVRDSSLSRDTRERLLPQN